MSDLDEVAILNAVVAPKKREEPFAAYMRLATQELAFFGHRDRDGNICCLTATSKLPSREELVKGWMSVPIVVSQYVEGVGHITSEPHYPTRSEAEEKFPIPVVSHSFP